MTGYRRTSLLLWLVLVVLAGGCEHDVYTITLTQRGGKLQRQFSVHSKGKALESRDRAEARTQPAETTTTQTTGPVAVDRFDRLAELYGSKPELEGTRLIVEAEFGERMPDDLGGGTGRFYHYPTSLGSASCYVESFRGSNDIWGQLQLRLRGVDTGVDVLRATLRGQLGNVQDFARFDEFLNTPFRHDAKSLAVYLWRFNGVQVGPGIAGPLDLQPLLKKLPKPGPPRLTTQPAETQPASQPTTRPGGVEEDAAQSLKNLLIQDGMKLQIVRAAVFLIDRGYLTREQLPRLLSITDQPDWQGRVVGLLLDRAGIPGQSPLRSAMDKLLSEPERFMELLRQQAARTDAWKQAAGELKLDPDTGEEAMRTAIAQRWMKRTGIAAALNLHFDLFGTNDELVLSLNITGEILENGTNGQVDEEAGTLTWNARLPDYDPLGQYANLPLACYAIWTHAEEAFQNKHLGKVVLTRGDNDLLHYALWVNSLPENKRQQWEAKLRTITPETVGTLKEFSFEGEDGPAWQTHEAVRSLYNSCNPDTLEPPGKAAKAK